MRPGPIIDTALELLYWAILVRALLSWFGATNRTLVSIRSLLDDLTEPILIPLRRLIPQSGMFDITPLIAMLLIEVVRGVLHRLLF